MNIEPVAIHSAGRPPRRRLSRLLKHPYRLDRGVWRAVFAGVGAAGSAGSAIGALGAPTGLGAGFDAAAAVLLYALGLALSGWIGASLHRLVRWELPPLTVAGAIYSAAVLSSILDSAQLGLIFSIVVSLLWLLIGGAAGALVGIGASRRFRPSARAAAGLAVAIGIGAPLGFASLPSGSDIPAFADAGGAAAADSAAGTALEPLTAADPTQPGSYSVRTFTYGSGTNRQREEFGAGAALTSMPVDGSRYVAHWTWLRSLYWGFDPHSLPLNGTVWMPEGEGPFPLVLIVHGNHLMEDFSDGGYAYLGELLASRGYVAVSVDENFLNYSVWSGIPSGDMKPRAWLLLQHIGQLQRFAADSASPLYGKIDFASVALLGHSRGGQAAAMAADPDEWFARDDSLPDPSSYRIRAVIALAPTDTMVDGKFARLRDISYLTLQGTADADLVSFYGGNQYERTDFTAGSSAFKASLLIGGANHGQFNTTWGAKDASLPAGLFLRDPELSGEDQRRVAQAYVSAFLDTVTGRADYTALFRDARAGASFLPDTPYVSRYENGSFVPVARYEEGRDRSPLVSATARSEGAISGRVEDARDRDGRETPNHGVELRWQSAGGSYSLVADGTFTWPEAAAASTDIAPPAASADGVYLVFALSDLTWRLRPDETQERSSLQVTVSLEDEAGETASVKLADVMPLRSAPRTTFTRLGWLEETMADGKFKNEFEPAFQTYEIPLAAFRLANPSLRTDELKRIEFSFAGQPGQAMLDDVGFMS